MFVIEFDQERRLRKKLYLDVILLDVSILAFTSIEFRGSEAGKKFRMGQLVEPRARAAMATARMFGVRLELLDNSGRVDFSYFRGKWFLDYARNNAQFYVEIPEHMARDSTGQATATQFSYEAQRELLINGGDRSVRAAPIPEAERLSSDARMATALGAYEDDYWGNYNILPPSQSLRQVATQLGQSQQE
ncbi:MAG: hypothetical protein OHK0039_22210 [Bacteroidia bacterium]